MEIVPYGTRLASEKFFSDFFKLSSILEKSVVRLFEFGRTARFEPPTY